MKFWRFGSIRARMTMAFGVFVSLLFLVTGGAFGWYLESQERHRTDASIAQALDELREEIGDAGTKSPPISPAPQTLQGDWARIAAIIERPSDELRSSNAMLLLVDGRGVIRATSNRQGMQGVRWPLSGDWRFASLRRGDSSLVVARHWSQIQGRVREQKRQLALLGALGVLFSALGAWILVGRTLSPLDGLARQARAARSESLHLQLQTPSSDAEMRNLVATLNDLLGRLAQTAAAQGRFYAAASHELRTPLHSLSVLQEVALSRPRSAPEYEAALRQSHEQTARLTRLVQDLLFLNQLEAPSALPDAVCLDLADICEGELRDLGAQIAQKRLQISTQLPAVCEISAPWSHVKILVRNLSENAIKYASEGGRIEVEASPSRVRIWNQCPIAADFDAQKWFEPFYRPDSARQSQTRHSPTGGNGLGLSICRAVCQTNGWELTLEAQNGGVCAVVTFGPLATGL